MFFTGTFSIEDSFLNTAQKPHDEHHPYDDDVISRIAEDEIALMMCDFTAKDGFVSNVGDTVTIHIREEYLIYAATIEIIKKKFCLSEENGVKSVSVVPFSGWEHFKAN